MRTNEDVLAFFNVIAAGAGFGIVSVVASLGVHAGIQAYSREQEREADDLSLGFMVEGGYDLGEAPKIWDQLIREKQVSDDSSRLTLFASHPELEERRETLTHRAKQILQNRLHGQLAQDEYQSHVLPHRNDFLRDELNLRQFARTEVLLDMLIKNGVKRADDYFFLGELYRLRDQKGDVEKAVIAYQQAIESGEPPPETFRSLGMCHLKSGAAEKARDAFIKYLKLRPSAVDRDVINQMLQSAG